MHRFKYSYNLPSCVATRRISSEGSPGCQSSKLAALGQLLVYLLDLATRTPQRNFDIA